MHRCSIVVVGVGVVVAVTCCWLVGSLWFYVVGCCCCLFGVVCESLLMFLANFVLVVGCCGCGLLLFVAVVCYY